MGASTESGCRAEKVAPYMGTLSWMPIRPRPAETTETLNCAADAARDTSSLPVHQYSPAYRSAATYRRDAPERRVAHCLTRSDVGALPTLRNCGYPDSDPRLRAVHDRMRWSFCISRDFSSVTTPARDTTSSHPCDNANPHRSPQDTSRQPAIRTSSTPCVAGTGSRSRPRRRPS